MREKINPWIHGVLKISLVFIVSGFFIKNTNAAIFEVSSDFSYARKNYSDKSFSWNRSWSIGLSYHFTDVSGIEVSFTDAYDKTVVNNFHTTLTDDQIISTGWVHHFGTRETTVRPFFKVGAAQVYRKLERYYDQGILLTVKESSLSGYIAVGLRATITDQLGFTLQGVSYLSGLKIGTWKDNLSARVGLSYYF